MTCTRLTWIVFFALSPSLPILGQQGSPAAGPAAGSQIPPVRDSGSVNVFFTVRDHDGALLPNLPRDEFELLEDGKPQAIQSFSAHAGQPLTLGLAIETDDRMNRMLDAVKQAAPDFLRQVVTDKDQGFLVTFDTGVILQQGLTSDQALFGRGLIGVNINVGAGSVETGSSEGSAASVPFNRYPGLKKPPAPIALPKSVLLFDTLYAASQQVLSKQVGRKVVVLLTNGVDQGSRHTLRETIEAAQRADALCYVLLLYDPRYPVDTQNPWRLAVETGGQMIEVTHPSQIAHAFGQIALGLQSQYFASYVSPAASRDGSFHAIEIRSRSGYQVQARRGYYAPSK
jgi:VWFA-related protein